MTEYRTPKSKTEMPIPDVLLPSIEKAKARTLTRRHGPPVMLERGEDGSLAWNLPFGLESERNEWVWLVMDAFGTRTQAVAATFLQHLVQLCSSTFDEEAQEWVPDDGELMTILHIVSAHRPRDEAQAALAAQMAATHLITMKVAKRVADYTYDTRMISAYAKLIRASAAQFDAMAAVKGKRRSTRQNIAVTHEKHIHQHHHQHVHLEEGVSGNDRQAHAKAMACGNDCGPPMSCHGEDGAALSIAGGTRQTGLPHARRRSRIRSTQG